MDFNLAAKKKVYSVAAITKYIKESLEHDFSDVWIEGEVSNFVCHTSGHMYFTLKDEEAQIYVVMFRNQNRLLTFDITNGLHILVRGHISVYEKRGQYQLYAEAIEPRGVGALQLAFEKLKEKLFKEGLFAEAHKKPLPIFPRAIGVVTSPTGAAIRDILNIVNRRFSNVHIIINPVKVQGEGAAEEIARAIDDCNRYGRCDVLIVGRGGGSLEDLWAFNEECVARAIFRSRIPIISAVGHEIDYTISDFVADLRAPTPSAAAELVILRKDEWQERIRTLADDLHRCITTLIDNYRVQLQALSERYAFRQPLALVQQYTQQLDELIRQLHNYMKAILQVTRSQFCSEVGKLEVLSPLSILGRGFSVSYDKKRKRILKDVQTIRVGDFVMTQLQRGSFDSQVTAVND